MFGVFFLCLKTTWLEIGCFALKLLVRMNKESENQYNLCKYCYYCIDMCLIISYQVKLLPIELLCISCCDKMYIEEFS